MADINKLMQIINALEANGTDVEGILGSLLTPVPMPQQMQPDNDMQPVPMEGTPVRPDDYVPPVPMPSPYTMTDQEKQKLIDMYNRSRGIGLPENFNGMDATTMMERAPRSGPFTGPGPGAVTDMEQTRRMMNGRNNRSGILELLQRMR